MHYYSTRELQIALPSLSCVAQITHSVQAVALPIHKGYLCFLIAVYDLRLLKKCFVSVDSWLPLTIATALALWVRAFTCQMSGLLQFAVRQGAETESYMTSAERVAEYGTVPTESTPPPVVKPPAAWPDRGVVQVPLVVLVRVACMGQ